jgi:hypothetical protein
MHIYLVVVLLGVDFVFEIYSKLPKKLIGISKSFFFVNLTIPETVQIGLTVVDC